MRHPTHTTRLVGRIDEVGPGLFEVTLRADDGSQWQSQLTFVDDHRFRGDGTVRFPDGREVGVRFTTNHQEDLS